MKRDRWGRITIIRGVNFTNYYLRIGRYLIALRFPPHVLKMSPDFSVFNANFERGKRGENAEKTR